RPLRGRGGERGGGRLAICGHPSPCPSPARGEGTPWRGSSQSQRCVLRHLRCGDAAVSEATLTNPLGKSALTDRLRSGEAAILALLALVLAIVLPPFLFLLRASLAVGSDAEPRYGFDHFVSVITRSGAELWITTIVYALGSSALAIALGASAAWLVARTDAPFRRIVTGAAFLSLAVPVIIKSIGWIMLLGPNSGLVNVVLRLLVGGDEGPIALYSLGGMIFVEGMLW